MNRLYNFMQEELDSRSYLSFPSGGFYSLRANAGNSNSKKKYSAGSGGSNNYDNSGDSGVATSGRSNNGRDEEEDEECYYGELRSCEICSMLFSLP